MKQKLFRLFWLRAILFNMFLSMFIGSVRAETVIPKESTVLNETYAAANDSENMISPCDIISQLYTQIIKKSMINNIKVCISA